MAESHRAIRSRPDQHREHRVGHILGRAEGGRADDREDKRIADREVTKGIGQHDRQLHGGKHTRLKLQDGGIAEGHAPPRRLDRSGGRRGRGSGRGSHVQVIVAPGQGPARPVPVPVPAAGAARPPGVPPGPAGPPVGPPVGPPPAGLAGAMPPGAGGLPPGMVRPPIVPGGGPGPGVPMMRATGGRTVDPVVRKMTGGGHGGMGRLQKSRMPQPDEDAVAE